MPPGQITGGLSVFSLASAFRILFFSFMGITGDSITQFALYVKCVKKGVRKRIMETPVQAGRYPAADLYDYKISQYCDLMGPESCTCCIRRVFGREMRSAVCIAFRLRVAAFSLRNSGPGFFSPDFSTSDASASEFCKRSSSGGQS
jgi:hypothetical protein